ncbi:MAG: Crp/Fnr family transcriptional regulator [Rhodocyclaceae bacterium]|nr:Crp/Fnr family transcriptional regulator [Rhodocyclaceae bacterium]
MDPDNFNPFNPLSEAGKARLARGLIIRTYAPPAPVLLKGQRVSGAYFVVAGALRVYSLAPNGTTATLYSIGPGETCVFALNSLFNDLLYPAWVQPVEETTIALIPGDVYRDLFAQEPTVRDLTVRTLSTLVFKLMGELAEVHVYKLNQRLANLLLVHASSAGEVAMTQQALADHLGTGREVVARLLGEFSAAGLVRTARGRIRIDDPPALACLLTQL